MPAAEKKLYSFVGEEKPFFPTEEIEILLGESSWPSGQLEKLLEHLLYFSIIGIERDGQIRYIYDVGYDMDILQAELKKFSGVIRYHLHPAFWPAQKIGSARR